MKSSISQQATQQAKILSH